MNISKLLLVGVIVSLISGCAAPLPRIQPKVGADQREFFREGRPFLASTKPSTALVVSMFPEEIGGPSDPGILVTLTNLGRTPLDVSLANFALTHNTKNHKLFSRSELIDAARTRTRVQSALTALAGGLQAAGAGMSSSSAAFSGNATTRFQTPGGMPLGTGMTTFDGRVQTPGAARAASDSVTNNTNSRVAAIEREGSRQQRDLERLALDRETVFPGSQQTFLLMPEKFSREPGQTYLLRAEVGPDVHEIELVVRPPKQ